MAAYLRDRGVVVLASNVRVGRYEIDLLARDGDVVLVVEVRTRGAGSFQTAFESVLPAKARRVRAAGEAVWRKRFQRDTTVNHMRFDVAAVTFSAGQAPAVEYAAGVL